MTKEKQEFEDDFIKSIVQKGHQTILNIDFESQLMEKIYATTACKKEVTSQLNRSKIFFYCGLSLLVISILMIILSKFGANATGSLISILTLFIVMVFGIVFAGNYKRLCSHTVLAAT